ncbi:MAG: amidohydrolase family protein, partial [Deltaproteobacteria bacterium]|nr:amidohydrolase family protein [Deltaproteobacteria bacterium]
KMYPEEHLASFRRARENHVKIVLGSDTYRILPQGENAFELECMVKGGMSEMEALVAGTKTGSEALGLEAVIGSIEEGRYADLLVVDPDPLSNISNLRSKANIKMIMKKGDIVTNQL